MDVRHIQYGQYRLQSRETPSCSDIRGLTVVDVRHIQYGQYRVERHQVVRVNEV